MIKFLINLFKKKGVKTHVVNVYDTKGNFLCTSPAHINVVKMIQVDHKIGNKNVCSINGNLGFGSRP